MKPIPPLAGSLSTCPNSLLFRRSSDCFVNLRTSVVGARTDHPFNSSPDRPPANVSERCSMKWITRKNIKVDRVACPWLIRRFVDPEAEFLFVDEDQLLNAAQAEKATPFDAPKISAVKLNHRGNQCSFEAIISDYKLTAPGLARLALIVRAADVKGQESVAAEGLGLRAIAEGFAAMQLSDEERLAHGFPIYDALYEYALHLGEG